MLAGRIAGARAYEGIYGKSQSAEAIVAEAREELRTLRSGSTGERIRWGRERVIREIESC
jgi:hypothetical protein